MGLTNATGPAPTTRRIWPITTMIVVLSYLLAAYQLFDAAVAVVADFAIALFGGLIAGSRPVVDNYISTSMACLTTLPAFAAMIWCGRQRGSRVGLLLISGPAAVMTLVGLIFLNTVPLTAGTKEPRRALQLADLFDDLTRVNWAVLLLFVGFAVGTQLLRRLARHTEMSSAA